MLKSFFRTTNTVLLIVAILAVGFLGYMFYMSVCFPSAKYDEKLASIEAMTEQTRQNTAAAERETAERLEQLHADLRNVGPEGIEIADSFEQLRAETEEKNAQLAELEAQIARDEDMQGTVEAMRKEYALKIRELEEKIQSGESEVRICYWTLDDGPTYITSNFLDALDAMDNVHVTFFAANMANDSPNEEEMLRREMTSGHSVQNHSYAHVTNGDGPVYRSAESFREQIELQDAWLYEVTGFHPGIFRFPGGSAWGRSFVPTAPSVIEELGYQWVDWNCNLYDAGAPEKLPSSSLEITRAMTQISEKKIAMILGHDWNVNTLVAMREAIPQLQEKGYVFLPLFPESVTMGEATKAV